MNPRRCGRGPPRRFLAWRPGRLRSARSRAPTHPAGAGPGRGGARCMRASDPVFELRLTLGGHKQEDQFWNQTLAAVAAHYGEPDPEVDTQVVCVEEARVVEVAQRLALVR